MTEPSLYEEHDICLFRKGKLHNYRDKLVIEIPLTLYVNGTELSTLVCSPGGLKEVAIGFLKNEGIISHLSDVINLELDEQKGIFSIYTATPTPSKTSPQRCFSDSEEVDSEFYLLKDAKQIKPVVSEQQFHASHLLRLIDMLEENSCTFRKTGGVHSAALADSTGIIVRYEDIGRHNAVDKVIGYSLLNQIPLSDKCLVLSGRVASEILLKAARNGIPLILSRSAAMLRAVQIAEHLGISVVGFARGEQFNLYSHKERIRF